MKKELNSSQKKASEILNGPILILAGAGAGKTLTLTKRIINLIISGIAPQNILAITFTNKAAGEMKERILKSIEKNSKISFPVYERNFQPFISTFHSLGVFILRDNYQKLNISKYFTIYDRQDSNKAIKESLKSLNLDSKEWSPKTIINIISRNKGNFIDYKEFENGATDFYSQNIAKIWNEYEKIKNKDRAFDFDDLLLVTTKLLEKDDEIRKHYLKKWSHIHIDEYQDTNKVQNLMIELLTNQKERNIFAVGDDDQSVYGWRGSDIKNILEFEKKYDATKIFMEQNYRSTKNIIEASNYVVEKNEERYPKRLFTKNETGEKILIYNAISAQEEASFVAKKIKELVKNENWKKFAVLYRANFQSRALEEAMIKNTIPYQVIGTKFFDRMEVKDVLSYLRFSQHTDSLIDLKRIINSPKRSLGTVSILKIFNNKIDELTPKAHKSYNDFLTLIKKIKEYSKENKLSETLKFIIKESGFEKIYQKSGEDGLERLSNLFELIEFAKKYDSLKPSQAILEFLEETALMSDADENKDDINKVKLMTIHASKGLEFENVFIVGAEEDLFSPNPGEENEKMKWEEERRLFYVAMTRAKKRLFISWTHIRTIFGETNYNNICPFVLDIPDKFIEQDETFGDVETETNYLEW